MVGQAHGVEAGLETVVEQETRLEQETREEPAELAARAEPVEQKTTKTGQAELVTTTVAQEELETTMVDQAELKQPL